ncbi:MAG TPA: hypothetical protein PLK30_05660 [Blastocatellia bacterium]|nr:hypothetical protein [Blastocatellia bacterium]
MWSMKNKIDDDKLDRLSDELFRALEANDTEINTAAESPFLFRRIRARIESEQLRLSEENSSWFTLMAQVRQAIPVFALLAIVALASSLYLYPWGNKPMGNAGSAAEQQTLAGLPMFLQDDEEAVEASLVGLHSYQANQPNQR